MVCVFSLEKVWDPYTTMNVFDENGSLSRIEKQQAVNLCTLQAPKRIKWLHSSGRSGVRFSAFIQKTDHTENSL